MKNTGVLTTPVVMSVWMSVIVATVWSVMRVARHVPAGVVGRAWCHKYRGRLNVNRWVVWLIRGRIVSRQRSHDNDRCRSIEADTNGAGGCMAGTKGQAGNTSEAKDCGSHDILQGVLIAGFAFRVRPAF